MGHKSALAFGRLGTGDGLPVVAMLGRVSLPSFDNVPLLSLLEFHPYEGHPMASVIFPVRVMAKLGVKDLISKS
jgi:purine-nucleoside phosphorylase